jgi:hypothetical protein
MPSSAFISLPICLNVDPKPIADAGGYNAKRVSRCSGLTWENSQSEKTSSKGLGHYFMPQLQEDHSVYTRMRLLLFTGETQSREWGAFN